MTTAAEARRAFERDQYENMIFVPGGVFTMGSDQHYAEEAPAHPVSINGFWLDRTPVTNRAFSAFASAAGYKTFAEYRVDPAHYPGALAQIGAILMAHRAPSTGGKTIPSCLSPIAMWKPMGPWPEN